MVELVNHLSQRIDAQVTHKIQGRLSGLGGHSVNLKHQSSLLLENPEGRPDKFVSKVELATHTDVLIRWYDAGHRS